MCALWMSLRCGDRLPKHRAVDRLAEVVADSELPRSFSRLTVVPPRDDDHGDVDIQSRHLLEHREAIDRRHMEVEDQAVRMPDRQRGEKLRAGCKGLNFKVEGAQKPFKPTTDRLLVINHADETPRSSVHAGRVLRAQRSAYWTLVQHAANLFVRAELAVRHADEIRKRIRFHLLHDPRAVDLDRLLRRAQQGGHLLVQLAGSDERHDLTLARRQ